MRRRPTAAATASTSRSAAASATRCGPTAQTTCGSPSRRRAEQIEARLGGDEVAIATLFEDSHTTTLERFFRDRVVDALAGQGVIGTFASPRDPGTAYIAWHHSSGRLTGYPGAWTYVRGGMGNVSFALARAAEEAGAVVSTGSPVRAINPGEGVELEDGTVIAAGAVVCNADARRALALLDGGAPAALRERVEAVPMQSPVLKVNFALSGLPEFPAAAHATRGTVNATGGADAMHRACRLAQAGEVADELWCELYFQTVARPERRPRGPPRDERVRQYVPYALAEGTWDERRDEMADRVEASIERFAPDFRRLVVEREALGPPDIEREVGLTGGHIFQGECLPASCGTVACAPRPDARRLSCAAPARTPAAASSPSTAATRRWPCWPTWGKLRGPNSLQRSGKRGTHMVVRGRIRGWCPGSASSASPSANPVGNAHEWLGVAHEAEIPAHCRIPCMLHKRVLSAGDRGGGVLECAARTAFVQVGLLVAVALLPLALWAVLPVLSAGSAQSRASSIGSKMDQKRKQIAAKKGREHVLSTTITRYSRQIDELQGTITTLERER